MAGHSPVPPGGRARAAMTVAAARRRTAHPVVVLVSLTFTVSVYVLTVTAINVAMPQMQGSFAATQDQITWVVTANLLATAIVTPLSGWLANRFGRRRLLLWTQSIFFISSTLCGLAGSLPELVVYRAIQGASGAPIIPLSQAIILSLFPQEKHGQVVSIWAIGVTSGTIVAPIIGGWAAEDFSWRWVFLMVSPAAALCVVAVWAHVNAEETPPQRSRFDWTGFLLLAITVSSLQLMLDWGERLDWFESIGISLLGLAAIGAFYLFIVHVLTTEKPFLDLRLLADRNYAVGIILGLAFGMLYYTTLVLQPAMLQDLQGYPDSAIGIMQGLRGVGLLAGSFALLFGMGRLDPRINLFLGFLMQALAGYAMSLFDVNMTAWAVAWTTMLQGFGIGLMWSPITVVTFATLAPRHVPEAASVFHLVRNIGSSAHIAISASLLARGTRTNYAEMVEALNPFSERLAYGAVVGGWNLESAEGLAGLGAEIGRQANLIGYTNVYLGYAICAALVMPLVFLARRPPAG